MMDIEKIVGNNIQLKMAENNVSITDLAKELDVTRQTLTNYLRGTSIIDSVKLRKVAEYFSMELEDFFIEQNEVEKYNLLFRTSLNEDESKAAVQDCVIDYVKTYTRLIDLLGECSTVFPPSYSLHTTYNNKVYNINKDIQDYTTFPSSLSGELCSQIELIAAEQRKILNAESMTGLDLINAIVESGIHVFFINFGIDTVSGVSAVDERSGCYIFVNCHNSISLERQIFTVAHEYGHILMHRPLYRDNNTKLLSKKYSARTILDRMADEFAGYFLCPRQMISLYSNILQNTRKYSDLFPIKHKFQISLSALMMSLKKYGYISPMALNSYFDFLRRENLEKVEKSPISEVPFVIEKYNQTKNYAINRKIQLLVMNPKTNDDDVYEIVEGSEFENTYLDYLKQKTINQ